MMEQPTPPCKGCVPPKRSITCHAECGLYADYLKINEEYKKQLQVLRGHECTSSIRRKKRRQ